jgi:hypothetical protein
MEIQDFFQFHKFLAPVLIKVMYWIGLSFIALWTLAALIGFNSAYFGGFSMGRALLSLIAGAALALFWRILCEVWIVIFSINDRLGVISGELPKKPSSSS